MAEPNEYTIDDLPELLQAVCGWHVPGVVTIDQATGEVSVLYEYPPAIGEQNYVTFSPNPEANPDAETEGD